MTDPVPSGISGPAALREAIADYKRAVEAAIAGTAHWVIPPAGEPPALLWGGDSAFIFAAPASVTLPPMPEGCTKLPAGVAMLGQAMLHPPPAAQPPE